MKKSIYLFELIKSLTNNEKRYFKLFASLQKKKNKESNLVRLFNLIVVQKVYDEATICRQFLKGNKTTNYFSVAKQELYNLVLRSLRGYHNQRSVKLKVQASLMEAGILVSKNLNRQAQLALEKAKILAYSHELFEDLLRIIKAEVDIAISLGRGDEMQELLSEEMDVLKTKNIIHQYEVLYSKLIKIFSRQIHIRDKSAAAPFQSILDDKILQNENNAIHGITKKIHFQLSAFCYMALRNDLKVYVYQKKMLNLWETNLLKTETQSAGYISALANLTTCCIRMYKVNEAQEYIERLKIISGESTVSKYINMAKNAITVLYFDLFTSIGEFDEAVQLEKKEHIIDQFGFANQASYIMCWNITYAYFGIGDYDKALELTNQLLSLGNKSRSDIYEVALIFNLVLHYELGNYLALPYAIKNAEYYFLKKEKLYGTDKAILKFLRKIINLDPSTNPTPYFIDLRANLLEVFQDPFEREFLKTFDIVSWLDSKIHNKNFADIVKQKSDSMKSK